MTFDSAKPLVVEIGLGCYFWLALCTLLSGALYPALEVGTACQIPLTLSCDAGLLLGLRGVPGRGAERRADLRGIEPCGNRPHFRRRRAAVSASLHDERLHLAAGGDALRRCSGTHDRGRRAARRVLGRCPDTSGGSPFPANRRAARSFGSCARCSAPASPLSRSASCRAAFCCFAPAWWRPSPWVWDWRRSSRKPKRAAARLILEPAKTRPP